MKKLRVFFRKSYAVAIAAILGLLGFSLAGCEKTTNDNGGGDQPKPEYGCPSAEFVISDRVAEPASSQPSDFNQSDGQWDYGKADNNLNVELDKK